MIEILVLYFLCKKMGENLRQKGWTTTFWMQLAVVVTWYGSMVVAAIVYGLYVFIRYGEAALDSVGTGTIYLLAFGGGIGGVVLLFLIASLIPARPELVLHERDDLFADQASRMIGAEAPPV